MTLLPTFTYEKISKKLHKNHIQDRVRMYGFNECARIMTFLNYVCDDEMLDTTSLRYIYGKVSECLSNHAADTGRYGYNVSQCYFKDLISLRDELEFVISVSYKSRLDE
ncbi:hypothetical protein [Erwinia persicina]|uniref:Uncharacterized protein n=1 Tax=Erwinia persicina TaxID=55211 RepID=A0A4U3F1I1_9GAMM|nr:hypothetical protein [Erwinia persicina]MBC3948128.1 hypothetical protein [Erwinia persicina]MBD8108162.1 hypothetical protein [Erwinia persicina]MBD8211234.1 hypothetical protein [Erwinia persicina]MCQ4095902.1 hypothetical protein [Erwinia persicina]MCQ4102441.1 hypothetical protein [Erwinia persicina]